MNIFTKTFGKLIKKPEKEELECWYNNYHEKKKSRWHETIEGAAFSSPNQMDYSLSQQISNQQT